MNTIILNVFGELQLFIDRDYIEPESLGHRKDMILDVAVDHSASPPQY